MEDQFVKKMRVSIIPLLMLFSQSYQVVPSALKGRAHKNIDGGDPSSVEFCHQLGLDYVSCSPFRVAIARLAAGQAAIAEGDAKSAAPKKAALARAKAAKAVKALKASKPAKPAKQARKKSPVRRKKR